MHKLQIMTRALHQCIHRFDVLWPEMQSSVGNLFTLEVILTELLTQLDAINEALGELLMPHTSDSRIIAYLLFMYVSCHHEQLFNLPSCFIFVNEEECFMTFVDILVNRRRLKLDQRPPSLGFLNRFFNINRLDPVNKMTLLSHAVFHEDLYLVEALIEAGAQYDCVESSYNNQALSAMKMSSPTSKKRELAFIFNINEDGVKEQQSFNLLVELLKYSQNCISPHPCTNLNLYDPYNRPLIFYLQSEQQLQYYMHHGLIVQTYDLLRWQNTIPSQLHPLLCQYGHGNALVQTERVQELKRRYNKKVRRILQVKLPTDLANYILQFV
jgi:hypothetical protein